MSVEKKYLFYPEDRSLDSIKPLFFKNEYILFAYRCIMFGFCFAIQIRNWQELGIKALRFLTIQSATSCMIFWFSVVLEFVIYKARKDKVCPHLWKFTQTLYQIVQSFQLPIVIMYWGFLDLPVTFGSICDHGIWMLGLQIEFILNRIQFRTNISLIVLIYFIIVLSLNALFTLTGDPVYEIVTYKDFMTYVYIVMICLLIFANFFFCNWVQKFFKTNRIQNEEKYTQKQSFIGTNDIEISSQNQSQQTINTTQQ